MIESVIESSARALQPYEKAQSMGNLEKHLRYYLGVYNMDEDCNNEILQFLRDQVVAGSFGFLFILFLELQFISKIPLEVGLVFLFAIHIYRIMMGCRAFRYRY